MINSELNANGLSKSGTGAPAYQKQFPFLVKKVALRDVQNDNRSLIHNHPGSSPLLDCRPISNAGKVSGTKRLTPEHTSTSPCQTSLSNIGANEHFVYARKKFESEFGNGRNQDIMSKNHDIFPSSSVHLCHKPQGIPHEQTPMRKSNMHCLPVVAPNHTASMMTFSYAGPSVSISHGKSANGLPGIESSFLKISSDIHHSIDSKVTDDQQRKERFLQLQKFLNHCDESNQMDYIQMLLQLTPAELSRHAVELEKRAIQLTIEEGKEMQRVKTLNVLGKSSPMNNPS